MAVGGGTDTVATAAIFHHPDAVESPGAKLAGRRAAGQSFYAGLVRHAPGDRLHAVADRPAHLDHFRQLVAGMGWAGEVEGSLTGEPQRLARPGTLQVPGPDLARFAWVRRRAGQRLYSLCGITHTVATRRAMAMLLELSSAPVEPWDAVVCTSTAVRGVVAAEMDAAEFYLRGRFAAGRVPRPMLPVIPLGIDAEAFRPSGTAREQWRRRLGVPRDAAVVLTLGRLSVFEKMHPGPLMMALQLAAERSEVPVVLLMAGWFADADSERLHRAMADELAPSVAVHFADGTDRAVREGIRSAADIFALPADNIQETFGLAPVEAMAAGLPVVCSDWDGFRDTVEEGVTGFRIRTLMSGAGLGRTIAERHADGQDTYLQYLGFVQQRTAVDVRAMADALAALVANAGLRRRMGEAGLARARRLYDWSAVIPQHRALWGELAARRAAGQPTSERALHEPASPAAIDPFALYAGYATASPGPGATLSADRAVEETEIRELVTLTGATHLRRMVTRIETIAAVQQAVHRAGPLTLGRLMGATDAPSGAVEGAVLWLAKFDLIRIELG